MTGHDTLVVFGAGGHAKVVIDAAMRLGVRQIHLVDDDESRWGMSLLGYPVLGGRDALLRLPERPQAIVAIGNNRIRCAVATWLESQGFPLATVVHPSVQLGHDVLVGRGTLLVAAAVVNSGSVIGANVIVNTSATVDHDCVIGDGVHLAPGVHLCGEVRVEARSLLGVGAVVTPCVRIGRDCVIGAGAAVLDDIPDEMRVGGVPARLLAAD
ncbi:MAG: hypothetical protein ABS91_00600 [Thiobacillus sp. SCN 64-35]|nr:acetyltransferase [Betaproteobacteria bacterium SCN1]MBN8761274.1 acetyltransferase [Thiobacillus sp.]ODU13992.1 MAG: hypothetical protein ABS91_00600 [Thiobacillus sp. SCN 64-35]ODU88429.1 MAG: hypothetical protein ABT21_10965 [Thiobacillus sp. SCN 65-179]OJW36487.1 MAG: hypothetical protein BGO61_02120 [Thiobacillus sp. 65-69]